jgi:hypothetical protein
MELHLVVVPARVQGVEVGDAVDPEYDSFAIDDELLLAIPHGRVDDPRKAVGPVAAVPGEEPHAAAVAFDAQAIAIVLDLMKPVGAFRRRLRCRGQAELERFGHEKPDSHVATNIRISPRFQRRNSPEGLMTIALPHLGIALCCSLAVWLVNLL